MSNPKPRDVSQLALAVTVATVTVPVWAAPPTPPPAPIPARATTPARAAPLPQAATPPSTGKPPPGTLPVPCLANACASGPFGSNGFVSSGSATATQAGSTLTVNQTSNNVTLNWQSFNISADGTVQFVQPSSTAVALNQIYDANPSQIFGTLTANGRVFLINQNGIVFGDGAQVNVGGLVASTLALNPAAASGGLIAPGSVGEAAFTVFPSGSSQAVTIEQGATLQTANGGQILVFAPTITNLGNISTPGGQTLLAAGSSIYLASSNDPSLRGLLVEIGGTGGTVTNGSATPATGSSPAQLLGQISAADGNVTLAGLAVNQFGRVSATTSINENGSIRLQAGDHGSISASSPGLSGTLSNETGGTLVLGAHSDTEVTLDGNDPATTVASVPQPQSQVFLSGYNVQILADSTVRATGGLIQATATQFYQPKSTGVVDEEGSPSLSDGSRVYVADGALLDVSGASITLPVGSNVIPVQLRGTELANSPVQQNGPLRSQTVYVDIRTGTPLADISGEIGAIGYNVIERNLAGGTITIQSHGDAILAPGATLNVSGGQIDYTGGYLDTTKLLTTTGQVVDIGVADPNQTYVGIVNSSTVSDPKWGTSATYQATLPTYSPSYVEGKDAGTVNLSAPAFVFDATVQASTVAGLYQRLPDTSAPYPNGTPYRPYDQLPKAATLNIGLSGSSGSDFQVANLTLGGGLVLPSLVNADGTPFDPTMDPLPAGYTASVLRPSLIGAGGFGNVNIYANGKVLESAGTALALPPDGSFAIHAGVVDIEGSIDAPGGSITAVAEQTALTQPTTGYVLTVGPQSSLTARGAWVNDNPLLYPNGNTAPLTIDGGSILLSASALGTSTYTPGLDLAAGSVLDVSGGGQLTASGALNAGTGGRISLSAQTIVNGNIVGAAPDIVFAGSLRGYGFYQGGSLSLSAASVCIASSDCTGGDPTVLWESPRALASGGFGAYSLTANQGGLAVADGTQIVLQQQNWLLPSGFTRLPDQASLTGLTAIGTLPPQLLAPVSLSLTQELPALGVSGLTSSSAPVLDVQPNTPGLTIGAGASIVTGIPDAVGATGTLSLTSDVRIVVDGLLRAPGGTIALTLDAGALEQSYAPSQAIWLGQGGVLDASGAAQIYYDKLGQRVGEVFDGGTVALTADRGYVELEPGSTINVAGTTGILDTTGVGGGAVRTEQVASAGGSVAITAAEGVVLGGSLQAAAGHADGGLPQPAGGSFSLTLDGGQRNDAYQSQAPTSADAPNPGDPFSAAPREIVVSANQPPLVVAPGSAVPAFSDGYAYLSTSALQAAGFDTIALKASPLPITSSLIVPGTIAFQGNVTLTAGDLITLDAASFSVDGGATATVSAPYVQFGNSDQVYLSRVPAATGGTGTLSVHGGFIELFGTSALEGIGDAQFASTGDLRLRGLQDLSGVFTTAITGALDAAGSVELSAQQIYPSTLSQFTISTDPSSITNPTAGSITVSGTAGANTALLSAGGGLTLSAGQIVQDGVLRAPLGTLTLIGQSVTLGQGSITSTSTDGLTIPFGTTQGGIDWVYPLAKGNNLIYGADGLAPPAQRVTLQGSTVAVQSGAQIDVSSGGDLLAYEWINGVGGTHDVLSYDPTAGGRPTQFAILPGLAANVAPYDPLISPSANLTLGESVYLAGLPGLPAGVYQLLPSRYALLPGAFLVTEVAGYQDIRPGQAIPVLGGGTIIAGYQTIAGTAFGDSRTSGFDVVPASVVLAQAQYNLTSGNAFFGTQYAAAAQAAPTGQTVVTPRLPQDSGTLALVASGSLTLDGALLTAAASPGSGAAPRGAEVDISSANILVAPAGTSAQTGQIVLTPQSLGGLDAQTLLLGGLSGPGGIQTTAQSVEIGAGAALTAPQVLLTAQNQVTVDAGASVTAAGNGPAGTIFALSGDGAFLAVSAGGQSGVTRSGATGAAGSLDLAAGSTVSATGGAVYLEASNQVLTGGALSVSGGDLAVQSPGIVLGTPSAGATGTVLGANVLGAQGLRNLLLASSTPIAVVGGTTVNALNVTLDAPGLGGVTGVGDTATVTASGTLTLQNSQSTGAAAGGNAAGAAALQTLTLAGNEVVLNGGALAAQGIGALDLVAADAVTATASSTLTTSGDLQVTATRVTGAANVDLGLVATGAVAFTAPAQAASAAAAGGTPALGAALSVSAAAIDVGTDLVFHSGLVSLATTPVGSTGASGSANGITVGAGGKIDVSGVVETFDTVAVASPGGVVDLASGGGVTLAAGSVVDVSGGSGGQGGALSISAPNGAVSVAGTLAGQGAAGMGGSFSIDAQQFGDFATLNRTLNAGGFDGARDLRLRGPGDIVVSAGAADIVTAHNIVLEADQGSVIVDGALAASGAQGGQVTLAARNDVILNGSIQAQATALGGSGGTVQLETTQGRLLLASGSSIDVAGGGAGASGSGGGGSVWLRAPSSTVLAVASGGGGVALDGAITGSARTVLEGFTAYQNGTGVIGAADTAASMSNQPYADAANLVANTDAIVARLGPGASGAFALLPGIEIDATTASNGTGALAIDSPWNLYGWRFGPNGVPGVLTLRAQGGITFNASLSDGFAATTGTGAFTLPSQPGDSWSYRITAGADFGAASPLQVNAATPADVTIAACVSNCTLGTSRTPNPRYAPILVRTGDGFIDVAASGDFVLGSQASLLYTAGIAGPGVPITGSGNTLGLNGLGYPTGGGDIRIVVAGNVQGAPSNQLINDWLWRVGSTAGTAGGGATAWTVDFQAFQQGIAALGGGNVTVTAGGSVNDLSVSIPSIGVPLGSATAANSLLEVTGGGNLSITAGGSVTGGSLFVGRGTASVEAGLGLVAPAAAGGALQPLQVADVGALLLDPLTQQPGLAPVLALGDASASVTARNGLQLAAILNPTLLNRGVMQGAGNVVYYSTYGQDSAVTLTAVGGDLVLNDQSAALTNSVGASFLGGSLTAPGTIGYTLDVAPPSLGLYALAGNVDVGRVVALTPSPAGNLQVFAGQNVVATVSPAGTAGQLVLSDANPAALPSPLAPAAAASLTLYDDIATALMSTSLPPPDLHGPTPVYQGVDTAPVRVVAANGSVEFPSGAGGVISGIWSAKPVDVVAGLDVSNLNLVAQNLTSSDVTSVSAGRDITYSQGRLPNGALATDQSGIAVDGPGSLQVTAGRNIDLGTSNGIVTRANLVNPVLPASGASVSLEAGIAGNPVQYAAFLDTYVVNSIQFDPQVIAFVESLTGATGLGAAQAKQMLTALTPSLQRTFVEELFFDLLRQYGRQEALKANGDFSGAFAAIQALFPGANPNLAQGQTNPYRGNIDLYFSQVYSEQGGNISLLAPGGSVNVGLALLPASFGIDKNPDQLGIVARTTGDVQVFDYGDFQVNESRVFAADGGNILVWSTEGNIDAGRGAKTAISAPTLNIAYDDNGQPAVTLRAAIAGSGIQALAASPGVKPGDVDLFAPHGVVNANDAGIVAGNLTIAATAVLGANNITVSGTSVGVPVTVTGVGASFTGATSTAAATSAVAENFGAANSAASATPVADAAINWLEVFVTGLGEENCKSDDVECLKREAAHPKP